MSMDKRGVRADELGVVVVPLSADNPGGTDVAAEGGPGSEETTVAGTNGLG